jgi:uncharacterized protein
MRVVVDTNVFVSGLMLPASVPGRILAATDAGGFEIVLCEPILDEIRTALRYPKVRKRIALSDEDLDWYAQALRFTADIVAPRERSRSSARRQRRRRDSRDIGCRQSRMAGDR